MKFGSKKAIFGVIWGGFEVFGPCLGVSHPTHPHLGEISQKKTGFFFGSPPKDFAGQTIGQYSTAQGQIFFSFSPRSDYLCSTATEQTPVKEEDSQTKKSFATCQ